MNTVHLVLKHKWFDSIASGKKNVEYRDDTEFWRKRTTDKEYVVFHRGYSNTIMCFKIRRIERALGEMQIHLGNKLAS